MSQRTLPLSCVLVSLLAAMAAKAATVTVTDVNNGGGVTLKPGDTLIVALSANQTTGYSWRVTQNNSNLLRQTGSWYQKSPSGLMGAGGTQYFSFLAVGSGGEALELQYKQSWSPGKVPASDRYRILVVIDRPKKPETVTVTDWDNNGSVRLNIGDTLIVRLTSNPSTGYSWAPIANFAGVLKQVGGPTYQGPQNKMPGAAGVQVFTFKAVGNGRLYLGMTYQRSFSPGGGQPRRWEIMVSVGASPGPPWGGPGGR